MTSRRASPLSLRSAFRLSSMTVVSRAPTISRAWLDYRAQVLAGQVGTAAAGNDRGDRAGPLRGRDQRGRGARAGADISDYTRRRSDLRDPRGLRRADKLGRKNLFMVTLGGCT